MISPKFILLFVLVAVVLVSGCSQPPGPNNPSDTGSSPSAPEHPAAPEAPPANAVTGSPSDSPQPPANPEPIPPAPQVKEFSLTAKQWEFSPSTITVKKGDHVKLTIKSMDVTHGFNLPDFNVNANLEPNKETVVEFTADKSGTFTFFCSVFCGSGHSSMKGTLVVE